MFATGNPFISAYAESDFFGRLIFLGLFLLSVSSWAILIHKGWTLFHVRKFSREFISVFSEKEPLALQFKGQVLSFHPLFGIYKSFKAKVLGMNRALSRDDVEFLETEIDISIGKEMKKLEKNLFILPTTVSLAPFLGLLGTVWGILLAFSKMQGKVSASGNEGMLAGLSLALVTTVIGLLIAIPALIGNNYYRTALNEQREEMENFAHLLLSSTKIYAKETFQNSV